MQWGAAEYGWLLLLLFPACFLTVQAERLRQTNLDRLGCHDARFSRIRRMALLLCSAGLYLMLVAALCRPQWGVLPQQQESQGVDIMVALDTSRSMLADDLPPTRLAAAKKAVAALSERLQGDRISLIAFAGSAFTVCPLTSDYDAFRQVLDETGSDTIPRGGSDLASIGKELLSAFPGTAARSRLLILVSDGEDHGGASAPLAARLRENGITICSVTVGSDEGGIIPLPGGSFLKDRDGNVVRSRANAATLERFSGRNVRLDAAGESLLQLYRQIRPQLLQRTITNSRPLPVERFQLPLALALLLIFLESVCVVRRRA